MYSYPKHHVLHKELQHSSDNHSYTTRHGASGKFSPPKIKTNYSKRTVMYRAMHAWNLLPKNFEQISSIKKFKLLVKKHLANGYI